MDHGLESGGLGSRRVCEVSGKHGWPLHHNFRVVASKICRTCGDEFNRARYGGVTQRIEPLNNYKKRIYCSRQCFGLREKEPTNV